MPETHKLNVIDLFCGCGGLSEGLLQVGNNKSLNELLPPALLENERIILQKVGPIPQHAFEILAHVEWEAPMVRTLRSNLEKRWGESYDEAKAKVFHFDIMKEQALIHGLDHESVTEEDREQLSSRFKDNNANTLSKGLKGLVGDKNVDVVVGGPPCQAFSMAGRAQDKDGMKNDYRNYLFEKFAAVVDHFKPKLFVFENVAGLLSAKPGGKLAIQRIYEHFLSMGYLINEPRTIKSALFNLADFGVPQARPRVIIIGVRIEDGDKESALKTLGTIYKKLGDSRFYGSEDDIKKAQTEISQPSLFDHLNDDRSPILYKHNTVKDAFSGLPIKPAQNNTDDIEPHLIHHISRYHSERDQKFFKQWIKEKWDKKTPSERLEFYNKKFGKKSKHIKYRALDFQKAAPTVVAHLYKDGLMFIYPDDKQGRSITAREAALLQSFPPDYIFPEAMSTTYKMIGNAVPPLFARRLGEVIYTYLCGIA